MTNLDANLYGYNQPIRVFGSLRTATIVGCLIAKSKRGSRSRWTLVKFADDNSLRYFKAEKLRFIGPKPTDIVEKPIGFYHFDWKA